MNEQQLMKTIEDQNQVIISKDATMMVLNTELDIYHCMVQLH